MEPLFSLRNVIQATLSLKLMKDSEIHAWEVLIDQLSDVHLKELHQLFTQEHNDLATALVSLDEYLKYFHAADSNRHQWLAKIEHEDRGLRHAIDGILQSKRHWTGAQVDAAFKTDETVTEFVSMLAIRDLELMRKVIDLHEQAGEYDDDDGKPTEARETLIGIIVALQEHTWNREREEAEHLALSIPEMDLASMPPEIAAQKLFSLGRDLHAAHVTLGAAKAQKAQELISMWVAERPSWFKLSWDTAKTHLAAAALTVNISGTIAGLGTVSSHLLQDHLAVKISAVAGRA
jgi:hypothetical protein